MISFFNQYRIPLTGYAALGSALLLGQTAQANNQLLQMSLEELLEVKVTSVAKKSQKLADAAAAIHVLSSEDIRRSGMTTLPEVLRLVPGLQVAQINANTWAITSRGFNDQYADKLLVMIDGRTVYDPLFAGVYWDVQDLILEDIERIEVIRGPGGTLWGANAVNGVINVITKTAKETQGSLISAGTGSLDRYMVQARHGMAVGEHGHVRLYGKAFSRNDFSLSNGSSANDDWAARRGGFRGDWQGPNQHQLTLQGEAYDGHSAGLWPTISLTRPPFNFIRADDGSLRGGNLLARWRHTPSSEQEIALQFYVDHSQRTQLNQEVERNTYDLDFQHRFAASSSQEITWGVSYRYSVDQIRNSFTTAWNPSQRGDDLYTAFLQDAITLNEDLTLTVGSKFEENDYTGFEFQPSGRLLWRLSDQQSLWGAISRVVQTSSRSASDMRANFAVAAGPSLLSVFPNPDPKPTILEAYELGYRSQPTERLSLDVALFHNHYDQLTTVENRTPFMEFAPLPPHLVISSVQANNLAADTTGVEVATDWRITPDWRLRGSYAHINLNLHLVNGSTNQAKAQSNGHTANHRITLQSQLNLPHDLELDGSLYYTSAVVSQKTTDMVRADLRLGWRPDPAWQVSLVGQNLLDNQHNEFANPYATTAGVIPRAVYGQVTWHSDK